MSSLKAAQSLSNDGLLVDLEGLDADIAQACTELQNLPREEAASFAAQLKTIIIELDSLLDKLKHNAATLIDPE